MISSKHRFHGHNSLKYVYQHGKTVRGPLMSVKCSLNPRRHTYRVAIVVSKKINKSAVVRNRIRRRLYEAVRKLEKKIEKPYDIVITIFHERVAELTPDELDRLLRAQLRQSGILSKKENS